MIFTVRWDWMNRIRMAEYLNMFSNIVTIRQLCHCFACCRLEISVSSISDQLFRMFCLFHMGSFHMHTYVVCMCVCVRCSCTNCIFTRLCEFVMKLMQYDVYISQWFQTVRICTLFQNYPNHTAPEMWCSVQVISHTMQ